MIDKLIEKIKGMFRNTELEGGKNNMENQETIKEVIESLRDAAEKLEKLVDTDEDSDGVEEEAGETVVAEEPKLEEPIAA